MRGKAVHFYLLRLVLNRPVIILGKETCFKPKINTMRFKNSFINRLVFKYELAIDFQFLHFTFLHFLLDVKFLTLTCNKR